MTAEGLGDVQLHLVDNVQTAMNMMHWLGERREGHIAVDTETTGLGNFSPREDDVRMAQLGDGMHGWAIPWHEWGGVFREAVGRYQGMFVGHNLPQYDYPVLLKENLVIPPHRSIDTRLMSHVMEPTYSTGLKNLCTRYVDRRAASMQAQLHSVLEAGKAEKGWTWATVPVDYQPYWAYAALDTVLTARLEPILRQRLEAGGAVTAYNLEMAAAYVVQKMEDNGFAVDRPFTDEAITRFRAEQEMLRDWCKDNYGFTPGANASVAQQLIADGIPLDAKTKSGAIALDKEVLEPLALIHPLADVVFRHRRLTKLISAYLRHFLGKTTDEDNILYFRLNSIGARTGRMTMSDPSLHNLPRRSESNLNAITVRNCLVPRSPENILLMIDFDQIEMRILTDLTQDPALMAAVNDPDVDIFTAMARTLYRDQSISKKDARRQRMKNAAYSINYGAGAPKFAATAGIPLEEGLQMYSDVAVSFPGIQQMSDMVKAVAMGRLRDLGEAYVVSPLTGRKHPAEQDKMYTLVNYLIQGISTEIMKIKLVELDNAGFGDYMVLTVHDEQIFDAPRQGIEDFTRSALQVMNDYSTLSVPITAGASLGDRWGTKYDYDPDGV